MEDVFDLTCLYYNISNRHTKNRSIKKNVYIVLIEIALKLNVLLTENGLLF